MLPWTVGKRNSRNQDLDDEIIHDLELEADELAGSGMSREEAERASRRGFGNVLRIEENVREVWGGTWIGRLAQDLRYTVRALERHSGFCLSVLVSLALGIGVATALFSVVYALILAPYPYARPLEIREVNMVPKVPAEGMQFRLSQYLEMGRLPAVAETMAQCQEDEVLTGGHTETLHALLLTGNAFQFLGARPLLGRTIQPADIHPDGRTEAVVMLSYRAWRRWFGGNPNAIGQTIELNSRPRTVIGVMPPRFGWWTEIWLPLPIDHYDRAVVPKLRLRPGVSKESAQQQLQSLLLSMAPEDPSHFPGHGFAATLTEVSWGKASPGMQSAMRWLMLVAGLLLLISCASVANLQLARASARSREIAVRVSLGAGPGRMLRQMVTESVALSLGGGALGLLLSFALIPAFAAMLPDLRAVRPDEVRIAVDGRAVLFSVIVSLAVGVLCGLAPAAQCVRLNLTEALKDAPRADGGGAADIGVRNVLIVAEVALSAVLLFAAILTVRGFTMVRERDTGFQPVRILKAGFSLPPKLYPGEEGRRAFAGTLLRRLQSLPGVESAAIGSLGGLRAILSVPGGPPNQGRLVNVGFVSHDFVRTLGIPLRGGREFSQQEIEEARPCGLINLRAARLFWPAGGNPVGARLRLGLQEKSTEVTIVGTIADTSAHAELGTTNGPLVLIPYTLAAPASRKVFVRTSGEPILLWNRVKREVESIDRSQSIGSPWAVEGSMGLNQDRSEAGFEMALFSFVGLTGLVLAASGIYSVLSYHVARMTHAIGIRMALGATRRQVLGAMLMMGARLVGTGLIAGIVGCFLMASQVNTGDVPKTDALAIAAIVLVLMPPALLACYVPARKAVRLDPLIALRHE